MGRGLAAIVMLAALVRAAPAHALPSISGACLTAWRTVVGWPAARPDSPRSLIRKHAPGTPAEIEAGLDGVSPVYLQLARAAHYSSARIKDLSLFLEEMPSSVRETLSPHEIHALFERNEALNGGSVSVPPSLASPSDEFLSLLWTPKSQIVGVYERDGALVVLTHANYDQFVRTALPPIFRGRRVVVVETKRISSVVNPAWTKANRDRFPERPVVLLTGATSGLGLAMAKQLVGQNYRVILTGRPQSLKNFHEAGLGTGHDVLILPLDITSERDRKAVVDQAIERWGGVDILINNASITQRGSLEDTPLALARHQMETDYLGPRELTRAVLPLMRMKGRGRIINTSSVAGSVPLPMMEAYSAAKAALDAHTEALATEVAPFGVKVSLAQVSILPTEGLAKVRGTGAALDPKSPYYKPEIAAGDFSHWAAAQTDATPDSVARKILGTFDQKNPPLHIRPSFDSRFILMAKHILPGFLFRAFIRNSMPNYRNWSQIDPPGVRPGRMDGPLAIAQQGIEFSLNFVGDLRARAKEVSEDPDAVDRKLKAVGLAQPYVPPTNRATVKLEGTLVVEGNMGEFFELWGAWIEKGYGSVNDRQYADKILAYREWLRQFSALAKMPMTSEDTFAVSVVDGRMQFMVERTVSKFAGLIPTSQVDWVYRRMREPTGSNSFEKKIDDLNGDVDALQIFYRDLFDPRHVNSASGAKVRFKVKRVETLTAPPPSDREFEHGVAGPFGIPMPSAVTGGAPR